MTSADKLGFVDFVGAVQSALGAPVTQVSSETRLGHDLGLDSLALVELLVVLDTELGMRRVLEGDADRSWNAVTLGDLYEEYRYARRPPSRSQSTQVTNSGIR
ncbi:MAG TPA: phosphopantetheine-binding protein [Solirubrobacteraceae bacterium]|nr:phosphopantetheine-binding protein [Solirubrobacteraceae bacterium]